MIRFLPIAALLALGAPALAQSEIDGMPTFQEADGNGDGLVSLGEALYFIEGADVAQYVNYDADASAFLSEAEYEMWRLGMTTEMTLEDNA